MKTDTIHSAGRTSSCRPRHGARLGAAVLGSLALFPALASAAVAAESPARTGPPNVLFIAVDDLNDWVGAFAGNPQTVTPHLDRLADRGAVVFQRAYCPAPVCGPSRSALLSGFMPHRTGVYSNPQNMLNAELVKAHATLPEYFGRHGYRTLSSGKIFHKHFGSKPGTTDEGQWAFQEWIRESGIDKADPAHHYSRRQGLLGGKPDPTTEFREVGGSDFVVSIEFTDYVGKENECALVGTWEIADNLARITYRFRPKAAVREALATGERTGHLDLDDYQWELMGGGAVDPKNLTWDTNDGSSVRFSDLQAFHVVTLDALRDVEQDLRKSRVSPLERILAASNITPAEKDAIVGILHTANGQIAQRPPIQQAGASIHTAYQATAGEAHPLTIKLGMADASFGAVSRSLSILLSNDLLTDFDPSKNGLGLNNVLYISMLLHYFEARVASPKTAGQLLLVEEPEAHLHPQLQRTLYQVLSTKQFQSLVTTHSTHISSLAPLKSYVVLTHTAVAPAVCRPSANPAIATADMEDLERYLDATRSTLLYARKVMLLEGPAELLLLGPLIKKVMGVDLDRHGISLVPIYGVHFEPYAKLFGPHGLLKKCAIVADMDEEPDELKDDDFEDDAQAPTDLAALENTFVKVFQCQTTFERALTLPGTLHMLSLACRDCGFPRTHQAFERVRQTLQSSAPNADCVEQEIDPLRAKTLSSAKKAGKARFAQVAARHIEQATDIPRYVRDAVNWLMD